jgi:hypothetical protein
LWTLTLAEADPDFGAWQGGSNCCLRGVDDHLLEAALGKDAALDVLDRGLALPQPAVDVGDELAELVFTLDAPVASVRYPLSMLVHRVGVGVGDGRGSIATTNGPRSRLSLREPSVGLVNVR